LTYSRINVLLTFLFSHQSSRETTASDPSRERTERHLRVLQELAEIGMDLARLVRQRAMQADPATDRSDPGLSFARIARAVRQTVALEARLDEDAQTRDKRIAAGRAVHEARLAESVRRAGSSRKLKAAMAVERAVEGLGDTDEDGEPLHPELYEWLADSRDDERFADRPVGEIVMEICRDLGLTPDWSLWADEDWAAELPQVARPDDREKTPTPAVGEGRDPDAACAPTGPCLGQSP
jgi:hypothetical protein